MSLEDYIKEWVTIDNKMKSYMDEIRTLRQDKNNLTDTITEYAETNNLKHAVIQISDGVLKFQNTRIISPLTFKFVEQCLMETIQDEDKVKKLIKYIKNKRTSRYSLDLKRTYKK